MTTKIVVQLDELGYVLGGSVAEESPLEPGVYLIPRGCVDRPLPAPAADGFRLRWDGANFIQEEIPAPPPPPEPPQTPQVALPVSRRQFKQALTAAGIRAAAEAYVAAGDQDLKDWYNDSMTFEEDHPQILAAQAALGLSDAERRALFQLARTL